MSNVRQFSLINGSGEEINLLTTSLFLYEPNGLGFKRDDEYRRVGDRWILLSTHLAQDPISGTVVFTSQDPYQQYFDFVKFIQIAPLTLTYRPNPRNDRTYYRNVRISSLQKTEKTKLGTLECPIDFTPLAPWYRPFTDANTGSYWDWHWIYGEGKNSIKWYSSPGYLNIVSDSHTDSPCCLRIYGEITNPAWRHYVNDELFADGQVAVTVGSGQYLQIDNTSDPYNIGLYDTATNTLISNEYQHSNFSTMRFINLQYGTNSIRFAGTSFGADNMLVAEGMIYYESV